MTEESRSALMLRTELPALPDLVRRAAVEDHDAHFVDAWLRSWEVPSVDEGRAMRKRAYGGVAGRLAMELGSEGARVARRRLADALKASESVSSDHVPPEVMERLDEARRLVVRTDVALQDERVADAFSFVLEAADALREVGPEGVARTLILRAEGALADARAASEGDALPTQELERSERLVRGARLALRDGDWSRALRRAFYACQLLGVSPR